MPDKLDRAAALAALRTAGDAVAEAFGPLAPRRGADVGDLLAGLDLPPAVVEPLARLTARVSDEHGYGAKSAVLIATATAATALGGGGDVSRLTSGVRTAARRAAQRVAAGSRPLTNAADLERAVAAAALGKADLGEIMVTAFGEAGKDGMLTILRTDEYDPDSPPVRAELVAGAPFPLTRAAGWAGPDTLDAPRVAVTLTELHEADVDALAELASRTGQPCLALAPSATPPAVERANWLLRQRAVCVAPVVPQSASRGRDVLADVAVLTGTRPLEGVGPAAAGLTADDLGGAGLAAFERGLTLHECSFRRAEMDSRMAELVEARASSDDPEMQEWYSRRLAVLTGGIMEIFVNGATEEETARLDRLACSALFAGRDAIAFGVVPGGGAAYLAAAAGLPETPAGRAVAAGLTAPLRALAGHAGADPDALAAALAEATDLTFDARGPEVLPLRRGGPLDPTRMVSGVIGLAGDAAVELLAAAR
jgi:chaperonin GroEL